MTRPEGPSRYGTGLLPTNRLEAFSDGVFAIAITLLVLELDVPQEVEGLVQQLGKEWPSYVGYFVSFAFIGGVWMAHTTLTRFLTAADQVLLGLNLVLLPFSTNLMATHLGDPARADRSRAHLPGDLRAHARRPHLARLPAAQQPPDGREASVS